MEQITIYHNPRCAKSREALSLLQEKRENINIVEYLKDTPSANELKIVLRKLGMKAEDIIRKKEELFKEKYAEKRLSNDEWIKVLVKNPILIERPIVIKGNKAVIGRPTDNILEIL